MRQKSPSAIGSNPGFSVMGIRRRPIRGALVLDGKRSHGRYGTGAKAAPEGTNPDKTEL
jgi:hypothetical protein